MRSNPPTLCHNTATLLDNVSSSTHEHRLTLISGAGPGGAAAAYFLHKFAEEEGFRVNITVFEKSDRIGGRTLTVDAYGNASEPVELGASIFVKENHILVNATRDFDLSVKEPEVGTGDLLGIWNGESFVYTQDDRSYGWWNLAKLFWKYGMAPYKAQKLVRATVATFLKLYEEPHFPFKSLTERAFQLGLLDITAVPGTEFLSQNDVSPSPDIPATVLADPVFTRFLRLSPTISSRLPPVSTMPLTWASFTAWRPW
jgi:prenylcysteine oxidase/farnesylcysteine lyase